MDTLAAPGSRDQGAELTMGATEKTVDLSDMVWFFAKEQIPGKSFMHNLNYNLVRIAIGRDGIYKLDSGPPRMLAHWRFRDIKDSSYSGFSFTLQFRGGKSDYHVRTDDGEHICSYIEAFQKNPDKALEQIKKNPPVSNVPESGLMTLRRKFSADQKARVPRDIGGSTSPSGNVKAHTLNRRTVKKSDQDPYSSLRYNVDMDSRLRGRSMDSKVTRPLKDDARHSVSLDMRPQGSKPTPGGLQATGEHHHSSIDVRSSPRENGIAHSSDKQLARDTIGQHIVEKRLSNGAVPHGPVSTRGEPSNDSSMSSSTEKRSSSSGQASGTFHKAGSAPPTLPVDSEESPGLGTKSSGGGGNLRNNNKMATHSPLEQSQKDQARQNRTSGGGQLYDHLDDLPNQSKGSTTPTSEAPSAGFEEAMFYLDKRRSGSLSRSSNSSAGSGVYDHLPTVNSPDPPSESPIGGSNNKRDIGKADLSMLNALGDLSALPRRNASQPALSMPNSARESPCDQFGRFTSIDEESSDEDESQRSVTPTNEGPEGEAETPMNVYKGVTLRNKKTEAIASDPFADIMSPKSASRLRWSQELNPLYDIIKGFKVQDGVKLYDSTPSKLMQSAKASPASAGNTGGDNEAGRTEESGAAANGKPPSMIVEEEGDEEDEEGGVWDADILSNFSQDTMSMISQDTEQSPTSPTSSCGGDAFAGDTLSLPRSRRPQHNYEDIMSFKSPPGMSASVPCSPSPMTMAPIPRFDSNPTSDRAAMKSMLKGSTVHGASALVVSRHHDRENKLGVSPRLGKRELIQQRRSRTMAIRDDSETVKVKQKPVRVADALKDFSFVMREYRLFYVKMPNSFLLTEIFSINKPLVELRDKLCDFLGVDDTDNYELYIEGACLSTLRETETGVDVVRVNRTGLNYHVDTHLLPDQGTEAILLKTNLSFRMQGITTSRILALRPREIDEELLVSYASDPPFEEDEFHKCWISIVQGNLPCTQEQAVKLAALHYQAYFLDRTAVNSVVGFSRPTEFLPVEYTSIRGVEAKMYKEQEGLSKKSHLQIEEAYINQCSELRTFGAVFFPAREPRKKLLHSTKLKPVILGVSPKGILRVDPKTKELLGFWSYSVLKNWAYSMRTFVLAFTDKRFPVECNQAKWVSLLVDFFVDSIIQNRVPATEPDSSPQAKN